MTKALITNSGMIHKLHQVSAVENSMTSVMGSLHLASIADNRLHRYDAFWLFLSTENFLTRFKANVASDFTWCRNLSTRLPYESHLVTEQTMIRPNANTKENSTNVTPDHRHPFVLTKEASDQFLSNNKPDICIHNLTKKPNSPENYSSVPDLFLRIFLRNFQ